MAFKEILKKPEKKIIFFDLPDIGHFLPGSSRRVCKNPNLPKHLRTLSAFLAKYIKEPGNKAGETYKAYSKECLVESDRLQIKFNLKHIHEETLNVIQNEVDNNHGVKFEKYIKIVKDNFIALSGLFITVGGVITAIAIALRNGTRSFAAAAHKTGTSVDKILSPVLGVIADILSKTLHGISKILSWLSNNLGILLLGIILIATQVVKSKIKKKVEFKIFSDSYLLNTASENST